MSRQIQPRAVEFLADHPYGAHIWQLAEYLGSSVDTTILALRRMQVRGEAVMTLDADMLANTVWSLPAKATPPIFKAMETLTAMQVATMQQLKSANKREAVCA
jgi:hypothetical protein